MEEIAIVGNGPLTRGKAPYGKVECWGIAYRAWCYEKHYGKPRGFDRVWECHDERIFEPDYQEWKQKRYYPNVEECLKLTKGEGIKSSLGFMILEAIRLNPKKISLYGFDVFAVQAEEYYDQVPNLKYIVGLAVGKGIEVYCPPESQFFEPQVYGGRNVT